MNVFVVDTEEVERIKEKMKDAGPDKVHVLSDFDKTLTTAYVDGKKIPSVISILRERDYISEEYAKKARELFNTYHPIETDPSFLVEEKKEKMNEWWREHFKLLLNSNLNKKHIIEIVESDRVKLRKEVRVFLRLLKDNDIPIVILSSAGLGNESIYLVLKKNDALFSNIEIVSNEFEWDNEGNAIAIK